MRQTMLFSERKRNPQVETTCQRCGSPFSVHVGRLATAKYCSRKCVHPPSKATCKACGREFGFSPSAERIYCSRECAATEIGSHIQTHGESKTRLHGIWCHMKNRCNCETSQAYEYYGGRGIRVCPEWEASFEAFRDWANANGYAENLEIDRKDVNGNYEPDNCRWATRVQQMRNTRKRRDAKTSKFKGVHFNSKCAKWRACLHKDKKPIHLGMFTDEVAAAKAYDAAASTVYGEFASLNFPSQGGVPS